MKFSDLEVGTQFYQLIFGYKLTNPLILTKVEEYQRGRYETVNVHFSNVQGNLCRGYIYPDEDVELQEDDTI